MTSYAAIKQQIAKLEAQASALRNQEAAKVIASIRQHIVDFELSPEDIFPSLRLATSKTKKPTKPREPKYKDPKTGATWTGRGKPPAWMSAAIKNGTRDQFLLKTVAPVTAAKPAPAKTAKPAVKAAPKSAAAKKPAVPKPTKSAGKAKSVKPAAPAVTTKSAKKAVPAKKKTVAETQPG